MIWGILVWQFSYLGVYQGELVSSPRLLAFLVMSKMTVIHCWSSFQLTERCGREKFKTQEWQQRGMCVPKSSCCNPRWRNKSHQSHLRAGDVPWEVVWVICWALVIRLSGLMIWHGSCICEHPHEDMEDQGILSISAFGAGTLGVK